MERKKLTRGELLQLQRWNTPTVYNGWEAITHYDRCGCFNTEPTIDYMPNMGSSVGYAVTVIVEPSNAEHPKNNVQAWQQYREYVSSVPGPKIVVVQDLDKPVCYGAFWGEVNSSIHKMLDCVGTITDGAIRDVDEMTGIGFKAIARCLCVGHAYNWPVDWNCEVEVFGKHIKPGDLIHADKHGFMVIPEADWPHLLESVQFMDGNECSTVISTALESSGKNYEEILREFNTAGSRFNENIEQRN